MGKDNKTKSQLLEEFKKLENEVTKLHESEKLQAVLYKISEAATTTYDINTLYNKIHEALKEVINVDNFYIAHFDKKDKMLTFPFFVDSKDTAPQPKPLGKGLTEYVLKTGKAVLLNKDQIYKYNKSGKIEIIGSVGEQWMGVPLISDSQVFGVIAMNSYKDPDRYNKDDLKIISFVSEQIARAIEYKILNDEKEVERLYLEELFTSSPEAVALVSPESFILDINKQFTELFGYNKNEVIGKNIDELLSPKDILEEAFNATKNASYGKQQYFDAKRLRKDGTKVSVSVLGSPIKYKGDVLAVYAIYRDITDRIKAKDKLEQSERRFRKLSEDLAESNSMKELLLDVIAHDLKNPAGIIKGFAEMGLEINSKDNNLNQINLAADNLLRVIDNTTTLSRISIGDSIKKWKINITDVINRLISEILPFLEFEEMKIEIKLNSELLVYANPIISEVFRNYITNAIKYAKKGKLITVDAHKDDKYLIVNVKDYGDTIRKGDRKKIFLRSVQLGKTKGSGLGLAIVKRIADAHNAQVGVKPNKPTGNVFYIKFPK